MSYDLQPITAAQLVGGGGNPEVTYRLNVPPYTRYYWNGTTFAELGSGGGGGGGSGYLGAVASVSALTSLTEAVVGSTAMVGPSPANFLYELKALPYSVEANWQALQGPIPNTDLITIALVKPLPCDLLVFVAAATEVTANDGVEDHILIPSAYPHILPIRDIPGVATPAAVTVQMTTGSASTGYFSLEY